ncbi:MAG: putative Ig domain-containing protein [Bdellovibrionales bacterium]|nr:putative Ig domain-containing protein [Bdellovibrionales bacterium]
MLGSEELFCKYIKFAFVFALASCRLDDNTIRGQYGPGSDPIAPPAEAPENFSISHISSEVFYKKSVAIAPMVLTLVGTAASFSIEPALPAGFTLDSETGIISGTPADEVAPATYTISAHHADGRVATHAFEFYVPYEFTTMASLGTSPDLNPGDTLCADSLGNCTLRAAVTEANALSIPSIVNIPAGTYSFPVSGELSISSNLTLIGADKLTTILDGQNQTGLFTVADNSFLTLSRITLEDGRKTTFDEVGAAIRGGLNSNVKIDDCRLLNNSTNLADGGAIYSEGSVTIENCLLDGNNVTNIVGSGGAIALVEKAGASPFNKLTILNSQINNSVSGDDGGAIYSDFDVFLEGSSFIGNTATTSEKGGAIYVEGSLTSKRCQFKNNSARDGGAIFLNGWSDRFNTIEDSYFENNTALYYGGALAFGFFSDGFSITNSTFVDNRTTHATAGSGGAIDVDSAGFELPITISNCSFSGSATGGNGATLAVEQQVIEISHTIINDVPGAANCWWNTGFTGGIASGGYNIDSGNSCGLTAQGKPGDLESTDPLLDAAGPQLNGDTIPSILLGVGSPALNAVPLQSCMIAKDQRGVARPQGGSCDIGATEQ